jgi:hypothetical protein
MILKNVDKCRHVEFGAPWNFPKGFMGMSAQCWFTNHNIVITMYLRVAFLFMCIFQD